MNRSIYARLGTILLLWSGAPTALAEEGETVFITSKLITMTSTEPVKAVPGAVAVREGQIVWVGHPHEVKKRQQDRQTTIVDYGNRAILPGFIDAHGHLSFSAVATTTANVASPPVGPVETMADLQATLRDYIRDQAIPDGEWVVGMGYDDSLIQQQRHPTGMTWMRCPQTTRFYWYTSPATWLQPTVGRWRARVSVLNPLTLTVGSSGAAQARTNPTGCWRKPPPTLYALT